MRSRGQQTMNSVVENLTPSAMDGLLGEAADHVENSRWIGSAPYPAAEALLNGIRSRARPGDIEVFLRSRDERYLYIQIDASSSYVDVRRLAHGNTRVIQHDIVAPLLGRVEDCAHWNVSGSIAHACDAGSLDADDGGLPFHEDEAEVVACASGVRHDVHTGWTSSPERPKRSFQYWSMRLIVGSGASRLQ